MSNLTVKPTPKMRLLIFEIYGSVNAAAEAWGIEYLSLRRFVEEGGTMSLPTAAKIVDRTRLPYEELFVHVEKPAEKEKVKK